MANVQKRTFLPYLRGIDPEALRIGSLYLDPLNPDEGLEDKRFEFLQGIKKKGYEDTIERYTWDPQVDDKGVHLDFAISKETAAGFHFSEWLHIEGEAGNKVAASLEGHAGRRLKVRWPKKFLKEQVMVQEECEEWIRTQASISYMGKFGSHKWKAPEIYMCTGVQLVTGGDVFASGSRNTSGKAGVGGDPSLAAGLPPGTLKVKVDGGQERNNEANNGFGFSDERVWAAQFMEIDIEYGEDQDVALGKQVKKVLPKTIAEFRLKDIADLKAKGIRGRKESEASQKPPKPVARVMVATEEDDMEVEERDSGEILFDEMPYAQALRDTSWKDYDDCLRYLADEASLGYS